MKRRLLHLSMAFTLACLFFVTDTAFATSNRLLKQGMQGSDVSNIQTKLNVSPVTGYFGTLTEKAVSQFQTSKQLTSDGIVGPLTLAAITSLGTTNTPSSTASSVLKLGMENDAVQEMQSKLKSLGLLKANATGYFGSLTKDAVISFQKSKKLTPDGIAGPATLSALQAAKIKKPYTIALDPGHGGKDVGSVGVGGIYEKTMTLLYTNTIKSELEDRGYSVVLTRHNDQACFPSSPSVSAELRCRINVAENKKANALISVHMNAVTESSARGTETFYYGNGIGKKLATAIHQETKSSIGSLDRGVKEKNLYVIRYTYLPATLVEIGFITNEKDASSLQSSVVRTKYAKDLADGIDHYYGY